MEQDRHELQAAIIKTVATWPEDAQTTWHERAAMREYAGGQSRQDAERFAFFEVRKALGAKA